MWSTAAAVERKLRTFLSVGLWESLSAEERTTRIEEYIVAADLEITARISGHLTISDADTSGACELSALLAAHKAIQDEWSGSSRAPEDSASVASWRDDAERIFARWARMTEAEIAAADGMEPAGIQEATEAGVDVPYVSVRGNARIAWVGPRGTGLG
jgi:hypothetical protein